MYDGLETEGGCDMQTWILKTRHDSSSPGSDG